MKTYILKTMADRVEGGDVAAMSLIFLPDHCSLFWAIDEFADPYAYECLELTDEIAAHPVGVWVSGNAHALGFGDAAGGREISGEFFCLLQEGGWVPVVDLDDGRAM